MIVRRGIDLSRRIVLLGPVLGVLQMLGATNVPAPVALKDGVPW